MDRTPLNDNVRTVCASHWDGTNRGCGDCAIRVACHSGPTANLTYDALNQHRARCNAAADAVVTAQAATIPTEGS